MTRNGYLILFGLLLALAAFVFWPGGDYGQRISFYHGPSHKQFELKGYGYTQIIDDGTMRIECAGRSLQRRPKMTALADFWRYWRRLKVDASSIRKDVDEEQLAAYGIDAASPRLQAEGLSWSWALQGEDGFIYDRGGRRILRCSAYWLQRIDELAKRFDEPGLINDKLPVQEFHAGDKHFVFQDDGWRDAERRQRPSLGPRVMDLLRALVALPLKDPQGVSLPADAEQRLAGDLRQAEYEAVDWALFETDGLWFVRVGDLPVQQITADAAQAVIARKKEVDVDRLFAFRDTVMGNPISGATVYRGAKEWFTLDRAREDDEWQGESSWDLSWEAGRVRAPAGCAYMLAEALNALLVEDWKYRPFPQEWQAPLDPSALSLLLELGDEQRYLIITGEHVQTAHYEGRAVALPELLKDLRPERFIDPMIHNIEQTRLIKLQRILPDGGEVFELDEDRGWQQVYPGPGSVQAAAMEQVLAALSHLRADSARIQTAEDRAILEQPQLEIDARIAPRQLDSGDDDLRVEHTIERDWGLALAREGEAWRAVDKESGISYLISDERIRECFRPLDRPVLLPVVASRIAYIAVEREDGSRFELERQGDAWQLRCAAYSGPVDETRMRHYLRNLVDAGYVDVVADGQPISSLDRLGSVRVTIPGVDGGDVTWSIECGRGSGDLHRADVLRSTGEDAGKLQGSYGIQPEFFTLLCPDPRSLAPYDAEWSQP